MSSMIREGRASTYLGWGCEMLKFPYIETLARAKSLEMDRLRSSRPTIPDAELSGARTPTHRFDILVRDAFQPKFSVAIA